MFSLRCVAILEAGADNAGLKKETFTVVQCPEGGYVECSKTECSKNLQGHTQANRPGV